MKTQNHNQIFPEVRYHPSIQTHTPRDTDTHTFTHTDTHTPRDTHTFTHTAPATSKTTKKQTHTFTLTAPATTISETSQNQSKKVIIPKVRYHPTIMSQAADEREPAKPNPSRTQRSRPSQTGDQVDSRPHSEQQSPDETEPAEPTPSRTQRTTPSQTGDQVDPSQAVKSPRANGGYRRKKESTAPDLHKAARGSSQGNKPKPEDFPLGLGVKLDRLTVDRVEVLTRGQSTNPDWFSWRTNRITASVAHRIAQSRFANGKSQTPPTSYMAAITGEGPRVQTRAMSWGIEMEAEAVRSYQELKSSQLGSPVSVLGCGLFIDPSRPWLAGSPDGMVTDRHTGQRLLCLEVKCPFKHRHHTVEDACREDRQFCLEIYNEDGRKPGEPPAYRLKPSHSYYTQIQVQLAVTGLQNADLAVYTPRETAIAPVTFDPERWNETVCKLETFYREAVLPVIRQRGLPREM